MVVNGWKITAIIFMVLFITETIGIIYLAKVGQESINNKIKCSNDVCPIVGATSFIYEDAIKTCYCYNEQAEVIKQEVLK